MVDAATLDRLLDETTLADALREAFRTGAATPLRHHHAVGGRATHLLMPAWSQDAPAPGALLGVKVVNVFPGNGALGLPAVLGTYLLMSGETGVPLACLDGTRLTHWRTAAASGLAASYLARQDATRLAMVGAGALAPFLVRAHRAQRPIASVAVWNHRPERAEALAAALRRDGIEARPEPDLEAAVRSADIVSCATLSREPLVRGAWLAPGTHLDLVGAFDLSMREADDEALRRARLFVDTSAALEEGGDVALALRAGAIAPGHVRATLADLCAGRHPGRSDPEAVTVFKSVGTALEDLAAAALVWRRLDHGAKDT